MSCGRFCETIKRAESLVHTILTDLMQITIEIPIEPPHAAHEHLAFDGTTHARTTTCHTDRDVHCGNKRESEREREESNICSLGRLVWLLLVARYQLRRSLLRTHARKHTHTLTERHTRIQAR